MKTQGFTFAGTGEPVNDANCHLEETIRSMKEINGSSGRISKIVSVMDEIGFQINILALNAAIEAAQVGKAGTGFAVAAEKVRDLAQRSARSAKDTALLIDESIVKSDAVAAGQMEQVMQKNAAIAESSAAADEVLASHSQGMLALVDKLQSTSSTCAALDPAPSQVRVRAKGAPLPYAREDSQ